MKKVLNGKRFLWVLFVALMLMLGSGCAQNAKRMAPEELARVKRVAVVSLLGDHLHQVHIGTTIFTNSSSYFPVQSWRIDAFVQAVIEDRLRKRGGIECVPLPPEALSFGTIYESTARADRDGFKVENHRETLSAVSRLYNIDTFVFVSRGSILEANTNIPLHGYCLLGRSFLGVIASVRLPVSGFVRVVDARSLQVVGEGTIYSFNDLPRSYWKDDLLAMPEKDFAKIEEEVRRTLEDKVGERLTDIGLCGN